MYWHGTLSADMVSSSRPLQLYKYVAKVPLHLISDKDTAATHLHNHMCT